MPEHVCLIVPCFNEAKRLDLASFEAAARDLPLWLVFVDDGSTDGTSDLIRPHTDDRLWLVSLERNSGKAEAVRQGMLRAAELPFYGQIAWMGFWDADLSTPLSELPQFFRYRDFSGGHAEVVIGSRVSRLGSRIRRRALRHVFGRLFVTLSSSLLHTKAYDSQCGAKLFRRDVAAACFKEPFVTRWLFDLEILLRLDESSVLEYPLTQWSEVGGGHLKLLPSVWRTVSGLLRIWAHRGRRP